MDITTCIWKMTEASLV